MRKMSIDRGGGSRVMNKPKSYSDLHSLVPPSDKTLMRKVRSLSVINKDFVVSSTSSVVVDMSTHIHDIHQMSDVSTMMFDHVHMFIASQVLYVAVMRITALKK